MRLQDTQQHCGLALSRQAGEAVKDHTGVYQPLPKHQFAEVLVGGQQQGVVRIRHLQDACVVDARRQVPHVDDVVASDSESRNDRGVDILVSDQIHGDVRQAASAGTG